MFRLDVLQNQWLWLAMGIGLALVLCVALFQLALWTPRVDPVAHAPSKPPFLKWLTSCLPAVLILVYTFVVVFAVIYTLAMTRNPPNW